MYAYEQVARQKNQEMLDEARRCHNAWRVRARYRARRRVARAEQRMNRARLQVSRLRRELEAEA